MTPGPSETTPNEPTLAAEVPVVDGLGPKLRSLRRERGLSLTEVAEATRISSSFLSLVENGKNDLTVARLIRLVAYYGVAVSDLLPEDTVDQPEILRSDQQRRMPSRSEKLELYLLAHDGNRAMTPVMMTYEPGGGTNEFLSYESEQWVYVLEGSLAVSFEGDDSVVLEVGDSAYFSAKRPHKYQNVGDGPARSLHVRSPGN
jgi:transcriptional regulator with XRE-family HTH domain